jgi:hypothetical protein
MKTSVFTKLGHEDTSGHIKKLLCSRNFGEKEGGGLIDPQKKGLKGGR